MNKFLAELEIIPISLKNYYVYSIIIPSLRSKKEAFLYRRLPNSSLIFFSDAVHEFSIQTHQNHVQ